MKKNNENYKTILTIVIGFQFISVYFNNDFLKNLSLLLGLTALFFEGLNSYIVLIWEKLTIILSKIVPNILLGVVFYLILTPIAFLNKAISKRNLLQLKNTRKSTFISNQRSFSPESLEKIW